MKLSIVYNICNFSNNLDKSLESIQKIKDKNFEIIFVLNLSNKLVDKILPLLNFPKERASFVFLDQNLGHSYAYNIGLKLAKGDYIYFAGSKNIFKQDFMEKLNEKTSKETYDFIVINDGEQKKFSNEEYIKNRNTDVMNIRRKIFNRKFLITNNIWFTNYKNFNQLYLFYVNENAKKIGYIDKSTCDFIYSEKVNYNLYDILTCSEILFKIINESEFDKDKKEYYRMIITVSILYEFIYKVFKNHSDKNIITNSITNAYRVIEKVYPEYKENKYLIKNKNKEIPNYILNFKVNIKYCKNVLEFL
ncbi:MAG: glycosyltransferase family 2 protein [Mycoplasmoidaceae bacterium]